MYELGSSEAVSAQRRHSLYTLLPVLIILSLLAATWRGADIRPVDLLQGQDGMREFARGFFPPDYSEWRQYVQEMYITLSIALWGTLLAILAAIPLGLLSAQNIAPAWVVQPVRRLMDSLRAINEMVFAMLFIVAVGLGPFAGVLALWVHTSGVLAKLFAESVEAIDPRPREGIRATGAAQIDEIRYAIIPQVLSLWISFAIYRFESNVRSAMVVGMVGAGGIGVMLHESIQSFNFAQSAAILLIIVLTSSFLDICSSFLRNRIS